LAIGAEEKTCNEEKAKAQSDKDTYAMATLASASLTVASGIMVAVGVVTAPLGLIALSVMLPISLIFTAAKTHQHSGKAIGAFSGRLYFA